MKKFAYLFLFFIIYLLLIPVFTGTSFDVYAQTPTVEWEKRFSGNGFASGLSVKLDSSGNVYVLMKLYTDTTINDYGLLKYSPSGNLIWNKYYNGPGNSNDQPYAFTVSNTGDVYIIGSTIISSIESMLLVKFNTNGVLQWAKTKDDWGFSSIMFDKNENIILTGGAADGPNTGAAFIAKYNPAGDTLWTRKFSEPNNYHYLENAVIDDSNNIYACGYYKETDYLVLKYSSNGEFRWYQTYNSPQNSTDIADYIAVDSARNIYVVGTSMIFNAQFNNTLIKLNSIGQIQWERIFTGILNQNGRCGVPKGIEINKNKESIYYATSCYNQTGYVEIVILKYNSNGDTSWIKRNIGGSNALSSSASRIKLDKYGSIYLTGTAYYPSTTGDDFLTIKYNPNGVQLWMATYNGPLPNSFDYASDFIVDSNLIYVTGISSRFNGNPILWDAATIKYNQPIGIIHNNNELPVKFKLHQNYPNPFNGTTIINYEIPIKNNVQLKVYNSLGQLVKTIVNTEQLASYYTIIYNTEGLSSGVYFYSLVVNNNVIETRKFILAK